MLGVFAPAMPDAAPAPALTMTTSIFLSRLAASALALLLAGCAVQPNGRGGMLVGIDNAELFGTTLGTFELPGGRQGALRRDPANNTFSVKLGGTARVVPLPNATAARIAHVSTIGSRTVAVLETQERNCLYRYVLLAIEGTDVLQWAMGNCQDRPRAELGASGQTLALEFPENGQLHRYVYAIGGSMFEARIALPPGTTLPRPFADADLRPVGGAGLPGSAPVPPASRPATAARGVNGDTPAYRSGGSGARVIPAPPQRADAVAATTVATTTTSAAPAADAPARQAARRPARAQPSAQLPGAMQIPADEIKPVRIDLRNN